MVPFERDKGETVMRAVLISIRPEWVEKILSGKKTLEVRRNRPKLETPFKCYIYCTSNGGHLTNSKGTEFLNRKVVAEFVCDRIDCVDIPYPAFMGELDKHWMDDSCCTYWQLHRYVYHDNAYFWHISNMKIYDSPLELDCLRKPILCHRGAQRENCAGCWDCEIKSPPQSWCYVEKLRNG